MHHICILLVFKNPAYLAIPSVTVPRWSFAASDSLLRLNEAGRL